MEFAGKISTREGNIVRCTEVATQRLRMYIISHPPVKLNAGVFGDVRKQDRAKERLSTHV
jgi:hypothetical protein